MAWEDPGRGIREGLWRRAHHDSREQPGMPMTDEQGRLDLVVRDGSGRILLREVVRIVFYFTTPHPKMRGAARKAIVDSVGLVSFDALRCHYGGAGGGPGALAAGGLQELRDPWVPRGSSSWPERTPGRVC